MQRGEQAIHLGNPHREINGKSAIRTDSWINALPIFDFLGF
jgi:hypothetical protein